MAINNKPKNNNYNNIENKFILGNKNNMCIFNNKNNNNNNKLNVYL